MAITPPRHEEAPDPGEVPEPRAETHPRTKQRVSHLRAIRWVGQAVEGSSTMKSPPAGDLRRRTDGLPPPARANWPVGAVGGGQLSGSPR